MVVLPRPPKPHCLQSSLPWLHPRLQAELPGNRCSLSALLVETLETARLINDIRLIQERYAYCTDPAPGQDGKTCREIGASSSFRSKVENNDVWKVHQRAYKKYFARIRSGLMTKGEFEVWSRQAADLRDAALKRYARAENEEERQRIAQEVAEILNVE